MTNKQKALIKETEIEALENRELDAECARCGGTGICYVANGEDSVDAEECMCISNAYEGY